MDYILEVENLHKTYKKENFQLKDVSFKLPYGSIMGFIGENGSGKTTTLSIILNLKNKDKGVVKLFGREMTDKDIDIKEKIGVVFDMNCLPKSANATEIAKVYENIYSRWDNEFFFKTLERFKIEKNKKIKDYSKGMLMTLSIITALSYHPQLLILDEATSGLDPVRREEMLELFMEFVQDEKNSILFSSHITTDIEKIADYVTFIHDGQTTITAEKDSFIYKYGIVRCGKDIFESLDKKYIVKYLKKDYEHLVLISDRNAYQIQSEKLIVENPTLEEIIYLLSKGEAL